MDFCNLKTSNGFLELSTALPMTTASRTSGVAPLAVFFDTTVASSGVVQPTVPENDPINVPNYSLQTYSWNFGDPGSGNWTTGKEMPDGRYPSRNIATGFTAAHVYENPGTYTVTLWVLDETAVAHAYIEVITVSAFSGTTYYVSNAGSDSNDGLTPSTAFETLSEGLSSMVSGNRLLINRGDTFLVSSEEPIIPSNSLIGAYGTGTPPLIQASAAVDYLLDVLGRNGVTLMDLQLDAANNAQIAFQVYNTTDFLALRVAVTNTIHSAADVYGDRLFIVDSSVTDSGLLSLFAHANYLALLGNTFNRAVSSHNLYIGAVNRGVICNNNVWRPSTNGSGRHCLRIAANNTTSYSVTITDNDFDGDKTWLAVHLGISSAGWTSVQHAENVLFERNRVQTNGESAILLAGNYLNITIRNNSLSSSDSGLNIGPQVTCPPEYDGPSNVFCHDNTVTVPIASSWYVNTAPYQSGTVYVYNNTVNGNLVGGNSPL